MTRREYEMTEEQFANLLKACRPVMCIKVGNYSPRTPQENANNAWASLGREMGFQPMTVQSVSSKGERFFTAESLSGRPGQDGQAKKRTESAS